MSASLAAFGDDVPIEPSIWDNLRFDDESATGTEMPRHRRHSEVEVPAIAVLRQ
jgi:hypothetical protein